MTGDMRGLGTRGGLIAVIVTGIVAVGVLAAATLTGVRTARSAAVVG